MKIKWVGLLAGLLVAVSAQAEHTRVTNPNALSLEMFGRSALYTIGFDRVVNDDIVAGIGFGSVPLAEVGGGAKVGKSASFVPVYVNYYFAREGGSLYATGGASIVMNSDTSRGYATEYGGMVLGNKTILAHFGLGFESRSDNGFLFRLAGYGVVAQAVYPWFGLTLGWAF